jgi:hypothetical protein
MSKVDPMKEVQKAIWSLGDYRELSKAGTYGEELVEAAGVAAGYGQPSPGTGASAMST